VTVAENVIMFLLVVFVSIANLILICSSGEIIDALHRDTCSGLQLSVIMSKYSKKNYFSVSLPICFKFVTF
jgi:hypothetical protein